MKLEKRNNKDLITSDQIEEGAEKWVFEINGQRWSNNDDTAGDNFGSFIAGAKWVLDKLQSGDKIYES